MRAGEVGVWSQRWSLATSRVVGDQPRLQGVLPSGFEALRLPEVPGVTEGLRQMMPEASVEPSVPVIVVDLETSGLGAASLPFIIAVAWHDDAGSVTLQQWSIETAAAERTMLVALVDLLSETIVPGTHLLSFNGRSFDIPRLRARMRRLSVDDKGVLDVPHLDLIHPSRRLFRGRLRDCRLGTLEAELLGLVRRGDLEGREIAELFEQLQRHPDDDWVRGQLEAARRHNRADVLSLLALASCTAQRFDRPTGHEEALRAARHFVALGRFDDAAARLSDPLEAMLTGTSVSPSGRDLVMLAADLERRRARYDQAAAMWRWVCDRFPGDHEAHEALAKHLEHRERDPSEALAVASASSSPCPRRLARLRRKLPAAAQPGTAPEV
jgi:uncharacterized protein YprB with RNaseH-like and TPR domain